MKKFQNEPGIFSILLIDDIQANLYALRTLLESSWNDPTFIDTYLFS